MASSASFDFETCGLCGDDLENDRERDTGCCDDCAELGDRHEKDRLEHPLEASQIMVDDGDPVLRFPDGAELRLRLHVTEWTHESPRHGQPVEMAVETDFDDYVWWHAYPERSEVSGPNTEQDFPGIDITPEINAPSGGSDDGE